MLSNIKRRPEIVMGLLTFSVISFLTVEATAFNNTATNTDTVKVSGFDKYSAIHQEQEQRLRFGKTIYTSQNDSTQLLDVNALAEEYNNSIPDLTEEELQKYLIVEEPKPVNEGQPVMENYIDSTGRAEQAVLAKYNYQSNIDTSTVVGQLDAWGISYGASSGSIDEMTEYDDIVRSVVNKHQQTCPYPIPVNLVKAMIYAESGGNPSRGGSANGLMQIENCNIQSFIEYGKRAYGESWSSADIYDPFKNIDYGVYILAGNLSHYNGDYLKAVQAYNYSFYSLDKLISYYGGDWLNNRVNMASLNGVSRYGDSEYIEHVFKYYHA